MMGEGGREVRGCGGRVEQAKRQKWKENVRCTSEAKIKVERHFGGGNIY